MKSKFLPLIRSLGFRPLRLGCSNLDTRAAMYRFAWLMRGLCAAALAMGSCDDQGGLSDAGSLEAEENTATLAVGADSSERYLLSHVRLQYQYVGANCAERLCLAWSVEPFDSERPAKDFLRLSLPTMSGELALNDPQVLLQVNLPPEGPLLNMHPVLGVELPWATPCPECTGSVHIGADVLERTLHVDMNGTVGTRGSCRDGACYSERDRDAGIWSFDYCDGGVCNSMVPCGGPGEFQSPATACPNPLYTARPIRARARAKLP